jgi:chromosome segregation ATPase
LANCEKALKLAEKHVKIPTGILDAVALSEGSVSESNLVLYLSLLHNSFKDKFASNTKESLEKRLKELEEKVRFYEDENETLRSLQAALKQQEMTLSSTFKETTDQKLKLSHVKEEIETELKNLNTSHHKDKNLLLNKIQELNEEIKVLKSHADSSTTQLQNEKDNLTKERDHIKEELKGTKDKLSKEIEEITAKNEELSSNLKKVNRMREELEEISKKQDDNNTTSLHILRKHLIRHIKDMQLWKVYLESDRKYKPDPLNIISEENCEKLPYRRQLFELNALVLGENKLLGKLISEREIEAAEVVAVNIGKKKKRIKKNDPLIETNLVNVADNKAKKEVKPPSSRKEPAPPATKKPAPEAAAKKPPVKKV